LTSQTLLSLQQDEKLDDDALNAQNMELTSTNDQSSIETNPNNTTNLNSILTSTESTQDQNIGQTQEALGDIENNDDMLDFGVFADL
tara:strand:- start:509 stop:769 length:261 start_codon:yes stop_codon:yes gene_type:complete